MPLARALWIKATLRLIYTTNPATKTEKRRKRVEYTSLYILNDTGLSASYVFSNADVYLPSQRNF